MIISKKRYKKLLSNNKKLNKEVVQLENQIKYLRETSNEYYKGSVYWSRKYEEMRELFDNRETKSPIIDQRDAEINALKHMLERLEASQEENKLQTRTLNKGNNELIEQLSDYQRKLSFCVACLRQN